MKRLPRFGLNDWSGSFADGIPCDFEGWEVSFEWLGFYAAIVLARRPKPARPAR
jgi:hypothetical protein